MPKTLLLAAAALTLTGAAAGRSVTNINSHDGWLSVQTLGETMVAGSGRIARQRRDVGAFGSVHVTGPTRLELVVGPRHSVEIAADDNLVGKITSRVRGGELRIATDGSFRTRTTPVVRITMPSVGQVQMIGSGDGRIEGLSGGAVKLVSTGSGDLSASGRAASLTTDLYGTGSADLSRVSAPDVRVSVYGSGDARVYATGVLKAAVFGSGTIAYSGRPAHVSRSIHGSGDILPINQ